MNDSGPLSRKIRVSAENLGALQFSHFVARRFVNRVTPPGGPYRLYSKYSSAALWLRPQSSDLDVYDQIFRYREYRCLDGVRDAGLIIDCGANVGFASAYFLSRYPRSRIVAVEPDPGNFEALKRNLAPFGTRVSAHCTGVWSVTCGLVLETDGFGDGREWARTVRASRAGETPMMTARDIGSLIAEAGEPRVSILKIDIEGSEAEVFANGDISWLDRVDNLVIELHGERCHRIFHDAIRDRGFDISTCDELTVCTRPSRARAA